MLSSDRVMMVATTCLATAGSISHFLKISPGVPLPCLQKQWRRHDTPGSRLLITVLSIPATAEGALLSEEALAADWNRPEEDQAWASLAQA